MIDQNLVALSGRLGRDPESASKGDIVYAKFSLAVNSNKGTIWVPCVAFNASAKALAETVKKGEKLIVFGELSISSYEKEGVKHFSTSIIVATWHKVTPFQKQEKQEVQPCPPTTVGNPSEEVPF